MSNNFFRFNSYQPNTARAILLFISGASLSCLLVPLKVMPHNARVSCLIIYRSSIDLLLFYREHFYGFSESDFENVEKKNIHF